MEPLSTEEEMRRLELYGRGLNDTEIAGITGVTDKAIQHWRKSRRLKANRAPGGYKGPRLSDDVEFKRLELYSKGLSDRGIAELMGTSTDAIRVWRWRKRLKSKIVRGSWCLRKISPTARLLTPRKAFILGCVGPGDGYVTYKPEYGCYEIGMGVVDAEFASYFAECLRRTYSLEPSQSFKRTRVEVMLHSKEAVEDILSYATLEHFKHYHEQVPESIKRASNEIKSAYLRAFFDSQGNIMCCKWDKKGALVRYVRAFKVNREVLLEIQVLLWDLGIKSHVFKYKEPGPTIIQGKTTYSKGAWCIQIHDYSSLKTFREKIGFTIKRKLEILDRALASYKRPYYKAKRWTKEEIEFVERNLRKMTLKEIGEALERSKHSISHIRGRLHLMVVENQVKVSE